jgi:4'-phosphopantetheinyl transferase
MALEKLQYDQYRAWGLWRITESQDTLSSLLRPEEQIPSVITNPMKRLEYSAARVLATELMKTLGLDYKGLRKDEFGKPFPEGYDLHMSLSHSYPYVAAIIDKQKSVGIDLEQLKPKLLKIAPRVLSIEELSDAGSVVAKHCVYWCAKEAMIKIYGKKDLVFAHHLRVSPFQLLKEGFISGKIIVGGMETEVPLYYQVHPEFAVVINV